MSWLQLQLVTDSTSAKALEALMEEAGAISVTMIDAADQPLFEPGPGETPLWNDILLTGLFTSDADAATIIKNLQDNFQPNTLPKINTETLAEQNWERAWMDDFKPTLFGSRLWICPSWSDIPDPQAVTMMLDPGLAFGSGTHPTTSLCLEWLDSQQLEGKNLIDYGCGSGILGIAALLLGAKKVIGVDNDPQALIATKDNCDKNKIVLDNFPTELPGAFAKKINTGKIKQTDIMLANILAGPLIELAEYLSALVKPGGNILLSGILASQSEMVINAYSPWFELNEPRLQDGWVCLSGIRNK